MKTSAKNRLRALRVELLQAEAEEADEGAKTEAEEAGVDWPLEADEPELERSHEKAERGEDDFA